MGVIYMGYKKKTSKDGYYSYEDTIDLQYKGLFMEQSKVLTFLETDLKDRFLDPLVS